MVRWISLVSFALTSGAAFAQSAGSAVPGPGTTPSQAYSYGIGASGWAAIALWIAMGALIMWVVTHFRRQAE